MSDVNEAKVDKGRSDYGKASIRNYRRKGPGHGEPAFFDPENKRGKAIDQRRKEHKERRGVKGAKVPAYKVASEGMVASVKKGVKRHKEAVKKKKEQTGKAVPYAMLAQEYVPEEGYDHMRDKALERGTWKEPERKNPPRKPQTDADKKKSAENSKKALQTVKNNILKKYGAGAIWEPKTQKEEAEKKEVKELFGFGNKKYPYGKATKKNPRGKRDQAELDRAQAYIKKNPNFGKKDTKEEVEPIDEKYYSDNKVGTSTKGGLAYQYGKKKQGKLSQSSLSHERKSKDPELRMSKKEMRKSMEDDSNYEKKMGRSKPTPSNLKSALKKQSKIKTEGLKTWRKFLEEGNRTSRQLTKSKTQQTGNISADRGDDEKKNRESRKGLEKDLKKKGIGYSKGVGEYAYKSDGGKEGTKKEVSYQTSPGKGMSKRRFGKVMRRLGRKHGQESVITKDKNKPARLHDTQNKKADKSFALGKSKPGKNPSKQGETSGTKVRSGKLPSKTKGAMHYGK